MSMAMERLEDRLRHQIRQFHSQEFIEEIGTVTFIGDGIARAVGLENVMSGPFNLPNRPKPSVSIPK